MDNENSTGNTTRNGNTAKMPGPQPNAGSDVDDEPDADAQPYADTDNDAGSEPDADGKPAAGAQRDTDVEPRMTNTPSGEATSPAQNETAVAPANTKPSCRRLAEWLPRVVVGIVFAVNVQCAVSFILWPQDYLSTYQLSGVPGEVAIQALGVAFLMWNATYPPVIINPTKHRVLYGVVLVQQVIGLIGESAILAQLDTDYASLIGGINRFIAFDAFGLVLMSAAFIGLTIALRAGKRASSS